MPAGICISSLEKVYSSPLFFLKLGFCLFVVESSVIFEQVCGKVLCCLQMTDLMCLGKGSAYGPGQTDSPVRNPKRFTQRSCWQLWRMSGESKDDQNGLGSGTWEGGQMRVREQKSAADLTAAHCHGAAEKVAARIGGQLVSISTADRREEIRTAREMAEGSTSILETL